MTLPSNRKSQEAGNIYYAVRLSSDAWPNQPWQSQVEWIAPVIASQDRSRSGDVPPNAIAVRLSLGVDAPPLRLGQQVDVDLETNRRDQVVRLPLSALRQTDKGGFEALTIVDDEVAAVPVQTGLVTPGMAEITAGLKAGDQVISSDVANLQLGTQVTAQ